MFEFGLLHCPTAFAFPLCCLIHIIGSNCTANNESHCKQRNESGILKSLKYQHFNSLNFAVPIERLDSSSVAANPVAVGLRRSGLWQGVVTRQCPFPQLSIQFPSIGFDTIHVVHNVLQSSKEARFVQPLVAKARNDAVVAFVRSLVMQGMRFARYRYPQGLQLVDPRWCFRR